MKIAVLEFLLSEGELCAVMTPQFIEDCDHVLARQGREEENLKSLEPEFWSACMQLREQIAELRDAVAVESDLKNGVAHSGGAWWIEMRTSMTTVMRHESRTRVGLRTKGQICADLLEFASLLDGLDALQRSYLNDFKRLAHHQPLHCGHAFVSPLSAN